MLSQSEAAIMSHPFWPWKWPQVVLRAQSWLTWLVWLKPFLFASTTWLIQLEQLLPSSFLRPPGPWHYRADSVSEQDQYATTPPASSSSTTIITHHRATAPPQSQPSSASTTITSVATLHVSTLPASMGVPLLNPTATVSTSSQSSLRMFFWVLSCKCRRHRKQSYMSIWGQHAYECCDFHVQKNLNKLHTSHSYHYPYSPVIL